MCTEERKPHKHAALIKAWADGAIIQFKFGNGDWRDCIDNNPKWVEATEYRIKPAPRKTIGYRRYVYRVGGELYVGLLQGNSFTPSATVENSLDFVRWIDTEWQYHEVEVK